MTQANLTQYTDILDHLEASGNVPAGFWFDRQAPRRRWCFEVRELIGEMPDTNDMRLAIASLCHTIEGALRRAGLDLYWADTGKYGVYRPEVGSPDFQDVNQLKASVDAYRHWIMKEQNDAR